MKKYIEIPMEVLERLVDDKCVEGSLRRDRWTGKISFKAYNRQSRIREKDRLVTDTGEGPSGEETAVGLGEGVAGAYQGVRLVPQGLRYGARDGAAGRPHP